MFCRLTLALTILGCSFLSSCSRGDTSFVERLAILPAENLTNDAGLDWLSEAAAAVLAYDLTGPKQTQAFGVATLRDARAGRATRFLESYFAVEHGALAFHVTIEDPAALKATRTMVVNGTAADLAAAMNRLAKELRPEARKFPSCSAESLRLYGAALLGGGQFSAAWQADPNCAPVAIAAGELALERGSRDTADLITRTALSSSGLDAIDRAKLKYIRSGAKSDQPARLEALRRLTTLLPNDIGLLRTAATAQLANRDIRAAVHSWEVATQTSPDDAALWNELAYARAYNHDFEGARKALDQYQKLLPAENWNGLDSRGEIEFYFGDFASAERYFLDAYKKGQAPIELLKAAEARMMTGDLAGADSIFARRGWSDIERAQWEFLTGRRKQAIERLSTKPAPSTALQLALWKAQTGQSSFPENGENPMSRAIAALLAGRHAEAVPLLETIYHATPPGSDGLVRTLLAWSYARSGRTQDASKLLDLYPIPIAGNDNPVLSSLIFPRFVQLRAEVLHSEKDQRLAAQYTDDLPDVR